jgi:aromatic-L-amino-acid decarboxylase
MVGLPEGHVGVIKDSASISTLVALLTAREKTSNFEVNNKGFTRTVNGFYCIRRSTLKCSKGGKDCGYGKENIRLIPADEKLCDGGS